MLDEPTMLSKRPRVRVLLAHLRGHVLVLRVAVGPNLVARNPLAGEISERLILIGRPNRKAV